MKDNQEKEIDSDQQKQSAKKINSKYLIGVGAVLGLALLIFGLYFGVPYATTASHMRSPEFDHYHYRTQIVVNGTPVDFGADEYQQEYDGNSCSAELSGQPIDFHDNTDQMTHIHWDGVTGGEFLKYYGWNFIGGSDDSLGTRFDQGMMSMHKIPTFGNLLPEVPEGSNYYVYVGDENGYEQKDWQEFLDSDLEEFFETESRLNPSEETGFNLLDWFSEKAYAHGGVEDEHSEPVDGESDEERLTRINNLIGNVVIFVQQDEPSEDEVKARFNNLVPLHDSTCGG